MVLRSVDRGGHTRPSPALTNLEAAGLVRARETTYEITDAGRAALAASKATKLERIGWPIVWICLIIVALASVIELLA
jgi:DNA-binding PadR family transcriptional regulator